MRQQAVHGVHEHVLPDQSGHGGHYEKWRNHKDADNALSPHRLVQEDGQENAKHHSDDKYTTDDNQCGLYAGPK